MLKKIFSPIKLGKMEVKNRLVVAPMVVNYCNPDGTATEKWISYLEARAKGGWGLIITEDFAVDPKGKGYSRIPGLWADSQIESHAVVTKRVHQHGAKIIAQIYHAGRQTLHFVSGAQPLAPSALPCPVLQEMPRELEVAEIREIVEQFGDCALRAKRAGFDGVEIHGAHGYLIAGFMSPYSNKRTDLYGGCLMNRLRFPLEIIARVREKVGKDFVVGFRISGDEFVPGGRTIEDTKAIAAILEENGIDFIHVTVGVYGSVGYLIGPSSAPHGWMANMASEVKKVVKIPVISVNRINDPILAETIITSGKADLISMARGQLADPALPNKAAAGKFDDITYCIGCMQGCLMEVFQDKPVRCLVNPEVGKELEFAVTPAEIKKKVLVIGGGPAGMEAAIAAAKRGHSVQLFEKTGRLGGRYYLAAIPPGKGEITSFINCLQNRLGDLNVGVHLNTEITSETITSENPDVVIIATGSKPITPPIPGVDKPHVVQAQAVLDSQVSVNPRVLIIGGGMVGAETANHLANHGKQVTIVEQLPEIAADEAVVIKDYLMKDLQQANVVMYANATVRVISEDSVVIVTSNGEEVRPADTVVLACGSIADNELATKLSGFPVKVITVGDALSVRNALEAVEEGYKAGFEI
jgi:2,4-dienoyl-CoA reductase-like NADH-dependent reductase (Old Yellow Enzyme family)/thioredoxin reductase